MNGMRGVVASCTICGAVQGGIPMAVNVNGSGPGQNARGHFRLRAMAMQAHGRRANKKDLLKE